MRYTRFEISKKSNTNSYKLLLEFFVIIPIVATIIGALITKIIIMPYFNKNISLGNESSKSISKPLILGKEYNVFMLQVGVYSNKNNADTLVSGMNSKGFRAFCIKDGDSFRVIIGISEDENLLNEKQTALQTDGYKSLIHDYNIYLKNENIEINKILEGYKYEVASLLKLEFKYKEAVEQKKEINSNELMDMLPLLETEINKLKEAGINQEKLNEIVNCNSEIKKLAGEIVKLNDMQEISQRLAMQVLIVDKISNVLIK